MALGQENSQKDYFKDYMRTLVGRGTEFSVIQPELAGKPRGSSPVRGRHRNDRHKLPTLLREPS